MNGYVWTQDAIINLQYITMYGEIWGVEASEMLGSWDSRFEKYQKMAIEFSKNEPIGIHLMWIMKRLLKPFVKRNLDINFKIYNYAELVLFLLCNTGRGKRNK